jgi:hypothetical protein
MKSLLKAVALAAVLSVPVASFAQAGNAPLTRAQVREQLIQIEQAGYNPATANPYAYPGNIQAAEARVAAQQADARAENTSYGMPSNGSSQAGVRGETTASPYSPPVQNAR